MEYVLIIFRTIFLYILILTVFRLMGKREIGELSILDLVVFIMLAEMAVMSIEDPSSPLINTIIPMVVLMIIQIIMAFISLKSHKIRELIDGKPSLLINKGKIDENEMKKQRYNMDDLLMQLRGKDVKNLADVEFAVLEPSGKLSVIEKENNKSGNNQDSIYFPFPLIKDGKVLKENLETVGQTQLWLRQQLRNLGYKDIKKISVCLLNEDQTFYIDQIDKS